MTASIFQQATTATGAAQVKSALQNDPKLISKKDEDERSTLDLFSSLALGLQWQTG